MNPPVREQRLVFGEVADLYDRLRPGYPEAVFDRILEYGRLESGARALEIGAGTGRATLPLARRGLEVVALEPSPEMAELARSRLANLPGVDLEVASFEDYTLPDRRFQLVASAQAWHWVRPEVGFAKAARALAPKGILALLWNRSEALAESDAKLESDLRRVFRRLARKLPGRLPGERRTDRTREIRQSGLFWAVRRERSRWESIYSGDDYLGLLATTSDFRMLPKETGERLLAELRRVIEEHGGLVHQPYSTLLYLARRRD